MIQHKSLAEGRWNGLTLAEQLANTGSEVERSLKWREKNKPELSDKAFIRAIELLDLTLADPKNKPRLREIARVREALADFFCGGNTFRSTPGAWQAYFSRFHYLVRKHC